MSAGILAQNAQTADLSALLNKKAQADSTEKQVYLPFGKTNAKLTAGDITIINPEEITRFDNVISVSDILNSRVPGAYGWQNLRGLGNALIVIDGIPRSISEISLSEVEQITVLKDANSAMLYGVQANNGVILITTKRGQANRNRINVLAESGISKPVSYPKYLGSADYMELYNEALVNDGLNPLYNQDQIDKTREGSNIYKYPDMEYFNSTFLRNFKPSSRVEMEFSGGNKNAQYYTNIGWQRSGSLLNVGEPPHSDRLNLRSNLNFRLNEYINSHVDLATIFDLNKLSNGDFFKDVTTLKPNYYPPLIDVDLVADQKLLKTATTVNERYLLGGTSIYRNNVYGNMLLGGFQKSINNTGMFNVGLDFDLKFILQGLTFKAYSSFTYYTTFTETQSNTYAVYEPRWVTGKAGQDSLLLTKIGTDKFSGTQGLGSTRLSRDFALYGVMDYSHVFGEKHALTANVIGYMDKYNVTDVFQSNKHSHLGARVNYVYDNKYLVNFTSALVSSPKLAPDHRVGFSPSLSLAWLMSEENFLKGNSLINMLKLKASAGIINTDMSLSKYYSYENILAGSSYFSWGEGYRSGNATIFTNIGNDNLFYEKRRDLTAGAEALLFNSSVWVDVNYFRERKADQIVVDGLTNTYPAYLGGLYPAENFNEDKFSGLELGLSFRKTINDFSFEIGPSLLYLNSEVVKKDEFFGEDYLYRKGKPTGAIFGLESLGLFKDQADIDGSATQLFGQVQPGDIKYKDQNGDGFIDSNDEIMIGNSLSKFVGGVTLTMSFKNLTLFALATSRNGAERFFNNSYYWVNGDVKYSETAINRWTPENAETGVEATYPRLSSKSNSNNYRSSTFWLENNSLISLDRVQLTYDLPKSIAAKMFTKNLSLYARGSNLLNIAENQAKMELNIGTEPQYRNFLFGVKALF